MNKEDPIQNQIYETMQLKETDELLEIWEKNDRNDWTDEAFAVIERILTERLGSIPPQEEGDEEETEEEDGTRKSLFWISSMINSYSYISVIFTVLFVLLLIFVMLNSFMGLGITILTILIGSAAAMFAGFANYIFLQLISKGILLFLDIQENTRLLVERNSQD